MEIFTMIGDPQRFGESGKREKGARVVPGVMGSILRTLLMEGKRLSAYLLGSCEQRSRVGDRLRLIIRP